MRANNLPRIAKIRAATGLNQSQFWSVIKVTQSGGSRYEGGRNMPNPTAALFEMVYEMTDAEAVAALRAMRKAGKGARK